MLSYETVPGTQTDEWTWLRRRSKSYTLLCIMFIIHICHVAWHENTRAREGNTKETFQLRYLMEYSCFDINDFKDNPGDISFFTGFSDCQTKMLCYDIIKDPAQNLNYGAHERKVFDSQSNSSRLGRPRKLTTFQEFVLVLMKLRLGFFNRDLAHRFKVSLTSVSVIFRTWIRFLRADLHVVYMWNRPILGYCYIKIVMLIILTRNP